MGKAMNFSHHVAALVCGRRTKWVVLVAWLVVVVVAGPLAGKLTGAQKNDNSAWLPGSAESTKVLALQRQYQPTETVPAVIVYERESGISTADLAKVTADAKVFGQTAGVQGPVI